MRVSDRSPVTESSSVRSSTPFCSPMFRYSPPSVPVSPAVERSVHNSPHPRTSYSVSLAVVPSRSRKTSLRIAAITCESCWISSTIFNQHLSDETRKKNHHIQLEMRNTSKEMVMSLTCLGVRLGAPHLDDAQRLGRSRQRL